MYTTGSRECRWARVGCRKTRRSSSSSPAWIAWTIVFAACDSTICCITLLGAIVSLSWMYLYSTSIVPFVLLLIVSMHKESHPDFLGPDFRRQGGCYGRSMKIMKASRIWKWRVKGVLNRWRSKMKISSYVSLKWMLVLSCMYHLMFRDILVQ